MSHPVQFTRGITIGSVRSHNAMDQMLSLQTYDSVLILSVVSYSACTYPPPSSPTAGCSTLGCTIVRCSPEIDRRMLQ